MSSNTFGESFRVTTFGESHGKAVGVIVDGVPSLLPLQESDIQKELDRRKPGQSDITTPRKESDTVQILSGVFKGKTTGTPIMMILYNKDHDSSAYEDIKTLFRPGHADYTYEKKYGIRDWRGSGRASGRETAGRVAAGAIAKKLLLQRKVNICAYTLAIADLQCTHFDETAIEKNMVRACDAQVAKKMEAHIRILKEEKNSCGGIVECRIRGATAGLGEPVFDKLDAMLAHAMLSIGAVKAIEFGAGFAAASMTGLEHNDELSGQGFHSNNAGGILGGISTGEEIIFRIAVKPPSSIALPQQTIDIHGNETTITTEGRHDPCICPRIVPVVEAMAAIVLVDLYRRTA